MIYGTIIKAHFDGKFKQLKEMLGTAGNLCAIPAADWAGCIPPFKFEEDELKS